MVLNLDEIDRTESPTFWELIATGKSGTPFWWPFVALGLTDQHHMLRSLQHATPPPVASEDSGKSVPPSMTIQIEGRHFKDAQGRCLSFPRKMVLIRQGCDAEGSQPRERC